MQRLSLISIPADDAILPAVPDASGTTVPTALSGTAGGERPVPEMISQVDFRSEKIERNSWLFRNSLVRSIPHSPRNKKFA
jgi:hypothetical protein